MAKEVDAAVKKVLADVTPSVQTLAKDVQKFVLSELKRLGEISAHLVTQYNEGTITEKQATTLFEMQKNAVTALIAAAKGMGKKAALPLVKMVISSLKDPINELIGFKLIS